MPSFAFRTSLSEDAGVRSGFALNEADLLAHLSADSPLRDGLTRDVAMRVSADDYANTVGDLLFALGTISKPGMPSLGMRFTELLPFWRSLYTLDELLTLEAVANHYLQLRVRGDEEQAAIFQEIVGRTSARPARWKRCWRRWHSIWPIRRSSRGTFRSTI
jgi:restriction system protein